MANISAFAQVLGHADNLRVHSSDGLASPNDQGHVQECLESLKDAKEGLAKRRSMSKWVPNASSSLPKADYEKMEAEWKLDLLRKEYALDEKRASAMGAYIPVARSPFKHFLPMNQPFPRH